MTDANEFELLRQFMVNAHKCDDEGLEEDVEGDLAPEDARVVVKR